MATRSLVGATEAAHILGVSRTHLSRLIAAGTVLPLGRLIAARGAFVFDRTHVEAVADGRADARQAVAS